MSITKSDLSTALNLPAVDPWPERTQKFFDICQEKLGLVPNVLQALASVTFATLLQLPVFTTWVTAWPLPRAWNQMKNTTLKVA